MFDVSFIELIVIFVVALLVLGPDKLPDAIRAGALWFGRAKRSFNKVKTEIEQQLNADEIRRQLHNEAILEEIEEARQRADQLVKDTQKQLDSTQQDINKAVQIANSPAIPVVTSSAEEGIPTPPSEETKEETTVTSAAPEEISPAVETLAEPPAETETKPAQSSYN